MFIVSEPNGIFTIVVKPIITIKSKVVNCYL